MRTFFIALGLATCLCGSNLLIESRLFLPSESPFQAASLTGGWWSADVAADDATTHSPAWGAVSLVCAGALVVLYAVGLPARQPSLQCAPVRITRQTAVHTS